MVHDVDIDQTDLPELFCQVFIGLIYLSEDDHIVEYSIGG